MTTVRYQGRTHEIPDIWIAGFCTGARIRGEPGEVADAIAHWDYQAQLEAHDKGATT